MFSSEKLAARLLVEVERLREENKQLREAARKVLDYEHHPSRSSLSALRAVLAAASPSSATQTETTGEANRVNSVSPVEVLCGAILRLIKAAERNDIEDTKFSLHAWEREKAVALLLVRAEGVGG